MGMDIDAETKTLFLAMFARFRPEAVPKWSFFLATRYPRLREAYLKIRYPFNKRNRAIGRRDLLAGVYIRLDLAHGLALWQTQQTEKRLEDLMNQIKENSYE